MFLFGVTIRRVNAQGCLAALAVGFALGLFRLAVDTPVTLGLMGLGKIGAAGKRSVTNGPGRMNKPGIISRQC